MGTHRVSSLNYTTICCRHILHELHRISHVQHSYQDNCCLHSQALCSLGHMHISQSLCCSNHGHCTFWDTCVVAHHNFCVPVSECRSPLLQSTCDKHTSLSIGRRYPASYSTAPCRPWDSAAGHKPCHDMVANSCMPQFWNRIFHDHCSPLDITLCCNLAQQIMYHTCICLFLDHIYLQMSSDWGISCLHSPLSHSR